jgi:hypothetical protein
MKNLRPDTKLYIRERDVDPIEELISMGKQYERVNRKCKDINPLLMLLRRLSRKQHTSRIERKVVVD